MLLLLFVGVATGGGVSGSGVGACGVAGKSEGACSVDEAFLSRSSSDGFALAGRLGFEAAAGSSEWACSVDKAFLAGSSSDSSFLTERLDFEAAAGMKGRLYASRARCGITCPFFGRFGRRALRSGVRLLRHSSVGYISIEQQQSGGLTRGHDKTHSKSHITSPGL